ncbi:unnamed protein product [Ilex paraguariensis]|uniref:HMA domain-containing protein n=1 Tax=Ilex paraguariensis TaxID=185542 RepID=A0ABC8V1L6_9AQUA
MFSVALHAFKFNPNLKYHDGRGVKSVKSFDGDKMFAVVGEVDPLKLCEKIQQKQKKKVELVSPLPNKDKNKGKETEKVGGEWEKKKNIEDKQQNKQDNSKSKEVVNGVTGYQEVSIDRKNFMIKITGTMDVKALVETINKKLKKTVEIVPPKKGGGNEKNESGSGGGDQMKGGGDGKASDNNVRDGGGMMEGNRSGALPKEIVPPNKASGNEKNQKGSGSGGGGGDGDSGAEQGKWGGERKACGDCGRDGGGMMERNNSGYVPFEYQNPYANERVTS